MSKRLRDVEVLPDATATAMLGLSAPVMVDEELAEESTTEPLT